MLVLPLSSVVDFSLFSITEYCIYIKIKGGYFRLYWVTLAYIILSNNIIHQNKCNHQGKEQISNHLGGINCTLRSFSHTSFTTISQELQLQFFQEKLFIKHVGSVFAILLLVSFKHIGLMSQTTY